MMLRPNFLFVGWFIGTLIGAGACAPMRSLATVPTPAERATLEARLRRTPTDVDALTRLAVAEERENRLDSAATLLTRAVSADERAAMPHFLLGVVRERQGAVGEAQRAYERVAQVAPTSPLRSQADARLALVRRAVLRQEIREAIARESTLATAPAPTTIAVLPFRVAVGDTVLAPLARAMAEMLANDLSQVSRLRVLERIQIQALQDEIALGTSGIVDPALAARGGRILGAGRLVNARLSGSLDAIRVDADVVEVERATLQAVRTPAQTANQLFTLQTALALSVTEQLGLVLTPTERERIAQRPTQSLQALLAYGTGLLASDAGRYADAAAAFAQAARLDPKFRQAAQQAASASAVQQAAATAPADVAATLPVAADLAITMELTAITKQATAAATRNPAQEALGTEGVGKKPSTTMTIVFKRPGGAQ